MTTLAVAVIAAAIALACYAAGVWQGRRTARGRFDGWVDMTGRLQRVFLDDTRRQRDRYRLAWLSARRRAHRGRLLAILLREDER
jgi:hypothetical protein